MAEKLKVSREVANALDHMPVGLSTSEILKIHANNLYYGYDELKPLMDLKLEELATALIVGYEVEMTSHERIMKAYNAAKRTKNGNFARIDDATYCYHSGLMAGITTALDTLGITVEGVNDNDNNS